MTTTKSTGGTSAMAADSTNPTTVGLNNAIQRIVSFYREFELMRRELLITKQLCAFDSDDYTKLLAEFEAEKELRTNAQIERDALWLKLKAHDVLLQRVLDVDANCTGEAYAQLISDIRAAMEVQA